MLKPCINLWLVNQLDPENWGLEISWYYFGANSNCSGKTSQQYFCNYNKGCNVECGCKKIGLFCSIVCINCQSQSCSNSELTATDKSTEASFLEPLTDIQQEQEESEEDITVEVEFEYYQSE